MWNPRAHELRAHGRNSGHCRFGIKRATIRESTRLRWRIGAISGLATDMQDLYLDIVRTGHERNLRTGPG